MQQIVSLTRQNQISIPAKIIREWGIKPPAKVKVVKVKDEIRIKPVKDFWSLAGSLAKYARKDGSLRKLENKAWELVVEEKYGRRE